MNAPRPIPRDEAQRLARLRELMVLDSEPEAVFDRIAEMASAICGAPIALLSLIDEERQWFKANVGLPGVNETPRDVAFCAHAILTDSLFEVPDATRDPRFAGNPLVTGAPDIRFYAGAPLVLPSGDRVGTLCVIDREAHALEPAQAAMLRSLAAIATEALLMRRDLIVRSLSVRGEYERVLSESEARHRKIVEDQSELVSLAHANGELLYVNPAYARHFGLTPQEMHGRDLFDFVQPDDRPHVRALVDDVLASGVTRTGENRMVAADGRERWVAWTNSPQRDEEGRPMLHSVGRDVTARKLAEEALRATGAFLERTGRVAGVGGWQVDVASGVITWSDQTRRLHGVDEDFTPTLETALSFYAPEARPVIQAAVEAGMNGGPAWDLELPFDPHGGPRRWVRAVGEVEFEGGRPARLVGALQDVTERVELQRRLADNERFVRQITDSLPVRMAYVGHDGRYRFVNQAHCQRFGLPRERIIGRTRDELTGGAGATTVMPRVAAALAGEPQRFEYDEVLGGVTHRIESQLIPDLADDGSVRGFFSTGVDVTEARRQTATLRSVTEAIPAMVAVVGADRRYRFVNSAFERWCGRPREAIVGRRLDEVLGAFELERTRPWVNRALGGESVHYERDDVGAEALGGPRATGRHLAVSYIPLTLDAGVVDGFVGIAQDITRHKQEESRLLRLSQQDPLTGLLNRAGFEERLAAGIDGGGATLALLFIDLDHFKPVNDRHGHPAGDRVLRLFAQRLLKLVRPSDAVARVGGDEFAILLCGVREATHASAVADKVLAAAHAPFVMGALEVTIGASVGIAVGADPMGGGHDLVKRADAMLYRAKEAGRGRQAGA